MYIDTYWTISIDSIYMEYIILSQGHIIPVLRDLNRYTDLAMTVLLMYAWMPYLSFYISNRFVLY